LEHLFQGASFNRILFEMHAIAGDAESIGDFLDPWPLLRWFTFNLPLPFDGDQPPTLLQLGSQIVVVNWAG
jgi:hypothetical protein